MPKNKNRGVQGPQNDDENNRNKSDLNIGPHSRELKEHNKKFNTVLIMLVAIEKIAIRYKKQILSAQHFEKLISELEETIRILADEEKKIRSAQLEQYYKEANALPKKLDEAIKEIDKLIKNLDERIASLNQKIERIEKEIVHRKDDLTGKLIEKSEENQKIVIENVLEEHCCEGVTLDARKAEFEFCLGGERLIAAVNHSLKEIETAAVSAVDKAFSDLHEAVDSMINLEIMKGLTGIVKTEYIPEYVERHVQKRADVGDWHKLIDNHAVEIKRLVSEREQCVAEKKEVESDKVSLERQRENLVSQRQQIEGAVHEAVERMDASHSRASANEGSVTVGNVSDEEVQLQKELQRQKRAAAREAQEKANMRTQSVASMKDGLKMERNKEDPKSSADENTSNQPSPPKMRL